MTGTRQGEETRLKPDRCIILRNTVLQGILLAFLLAGAAIPSAGDAWAHSKKKATLPADGAVLDAAPEAIGMSFDKPMRITLIRLINADGGQHDLQGRDSMAPTTRFRATPGALAPGRYRVEWRGLSNDGHPLEGSFSFEIRN